MSFAQNSVSASNSESTELSRSPAGKLYLNTCSEFSTPSSQSFVFNNDNQGTNFIFNSQPMKRTNDTFEFIGDNNRAKCSDINRLNALTDTESQMMKRINILELKVVQLENDNISLSNQGIIIDSNVNI